MTEISTVKNVEVEPCWDQKDYLQGSQKIICRKYVFKSIILTTRAPDGMGQSQPSPAQPSPARPMGHNLSPWFFFNIKLLVQSIYHSEPILVGKINVIIIRPEDSLVHVQVPST